MDFERERRKAERIKAQYLPGTIIRLNGMDDPYAPILPGTEGEVTSVDDMGTLQMRWSNGRTLGVVPGEDDFTVISKPSLLEAQDEPEESQQMGGMKFE